MNPLSSLSFVFLSPELVLWISACRSLLYPPQPKFRVFAFLHHSLWLVLVSRARCTNRERDRIESSITSPQKRTKKKCTFPLFRFTQTEFGARGYLLTLHCKKALFFFYYYCAMGFAIEKEKYGKNIRMKNANASNFPFKWLARFYIVLNCAFPGRSRVVRFPWDRNLLFDSSLISFSSIFICIALSSLQ